MPPKSSNKKSQVSWFHCEKCKRTITSKERDNHEKNCPIDDVVCLSFDYIKDCRLITANFNKRSFAVDELNDTPDKYVNSLIFVSEGAMKICEFRIGQPLAVRPINKLEVAPIVRFAWPISDKFLSTVFFNSEDYESNCLEYINNTISLEKLTSDVLPAKQITLKCYSELGIDVSSLTDIELLLKKQMKDSIYAIGNKVILNFYNKKLEFIIHTFSSCQTQSESLESELEKLSLVDQFFVVISSSSIEILKPKCDSEESKADNIVSKSDIGGLKQQLEKVEESMKIAFGLQKVPNGVNISRGMLLYGPTGCGKTMICEALANISSTLVVRINTSELFSKFLGETEKNLIEQVDIAYRNYPKPTLIIIEDVHNLCPKQESNDAVKRVSVAFLSILDNFNLRTDASKIFVLATTGNIENLNASALRSGRLNCEVEISAPSPQSRLEILQCQLSKVDHLLNESDLKEVSAITHGFVGSDLSNLIYAASISAVKNGRNKIQTEDVNLALTQIKPSAMREVLIENPNVKWEDIGGQHDLKLKLKQAIEWPLLHPEKFTRLGIKPPRGILMFGPPGCSKTLIAKALATESKVNFLSIKGPELFSMWVGESERAVRDVFRKARQVAPSIIFFDEIDAIGGERSTEGSGTSVKERVLTQLLTELDGVNVLKNVTIVAATNRPDMIDKALLRPGRIDRIVYVGLPDAESRREIFRIKLKNMPLADDVDVEMLVSRTEGFSGAEIQAICHEAALNVLEEDFNAQSVNWQNFQQILNATKPRTSLELLKLYDEYLKQS